MDIVIITEHLRNIDDFSVNNSRFVYLARLLSKNHKVEIITSDFFHGTKKHFKKVDKLENVKLTVCHEPGYKKNICLKRFKSHRVLSKNIREYLDKREKPDVIYTSVPSLDVGSMSADYCRENNVRYIVDIQDLWPEAFKMVFKVPVISDIIFAPFAKKANYIYSSADEIVAVSKTYADRGMSVNSKCKESHSVFLGTNLDTFDGNTKQECKLTKPQGEIWLAYCGTLGSSYDLTCVFDALKIIKEKGEKPPKFIVMGNGPRKAEFEEYSKGLDVVFLGSIPYDYMCSQLVQCDIVVNPISRGAAQSIINKHADYAASGLPVINTQECAEYRELVDNYKMGFNCNNNDAKSLAEKLITLCKDEKLRLEMGRNARKCAEEKFDRKNSYNELVSVIEK